MPTCVYTCLRRLQQPAGHLWVDLIGLVQLYLIAGSVSSVTWLQVQCSLWCQRCHASMQCVQMQIEGVAVAPQVPQVSNRTLIQRLTQPLLNQTGVLRWALNNIANTVCERPLLAYGSALVWTVPWSSVKLKRLSGSLEASCLHARGLHGLQLIKPCSAGPVLHSTISHGHSCTIVDTAE